MPFNLETMLGTAAAILTTAANIPQAWKVWSTGEAKDLSLKMLLLLIGGLGLWILYGLVRGDVFIIASNAVGLALLGSIILFKLTHPD